MARSKIAEPCLICEQVGCRCGKPPKAEKPARKRAPKKETPAAPAADPAVVREPVQQAPSTPDPIDTPAPPKQSARAAMKARAARPTPAPQPVAAPTPTPKVAKPSPVLDVMDQAIVNVAPLLSPDQRAAHGSLIRSNRPSADRTTVWKERVRGAHDR